MQLGVTGLGEGSGVHVHNTYRLHRYRMYGMVGKGQVIWISSCATRGALPILRSWLRLCPDPLVGLPHLPFSRCTGMTRSLFCL